MNWMTIITLVFGLLALCVLVWLVLSVIREAMGLGEGDDDAQPTVEERKNERIRREMDQRRSQTAATVEGEA